MHTNHALNYALDLSDKYSAEIQLLIVIPPILIPTYSFHTVTTKGFEECNRRLEAGFSGGLYKAIDKVKKEKPNLKVSTKLERGDPDEKIVETAHLEKIDIIVMGNQGLGRIEVRNITSNVINKAKCPVLIVK